MPRGGAERGREAGEESLRGAGVRRGGGEVVGFVRRPGGSGSSCGEPCEEGDTRFVPILGFGGSEVQAGRWN